jgi:hypothetical protein
VLKVWITPYLPGSLNGFVSKEEIMRESCYVCTEKLKAEFCNFGAFLVHRDPWTNGAYVYIMIEFEHASNMMEFELTFHGACVCMHVL